MPVIFVPQIQYQLDQLYTNLHENVLIFSETKVSSVIPFPATKFDIDFQG